MINHYSKNLSLKLLESYAEEIRPTNPIKASNIDKLIEEIIKKPSSEQSESESPRLIPHKITQTTEIITKADDVAIAVISKDHTTAPSCESEKPSIDSPVSPPINDPIIENLFLCSYKKEHHFKYIDPSEAFSVIGSIITVINGSRPVALIDFNADPECSKYLSIVKKMDEIDVMESNVKDCHLVYRKKFSDIAEELNTLLTEINKRAESEGKSKVLALKRILDTCHHFGYLFHYKPDKIAEFYEKINLEYEKAIKTSGSV